MRLKSILVHEHAVTLLTVKLNVFSESVLRLGGNPPEYPFSKKIFADKIVWTVGSTPYRELDSIDGEPVVFEWKISQGALHHPQEVHKVTEEEPSITPQDFNNHMFFMSMYNDIKWNRKGDEAVCK